MEIKEIFKNLPKSPGVYHFLDVDGGVLYVGKAKNLKNRVRQYFLKELNRGPAIDQMVTLARDIKWIETESEIEAVILEAELIKTLKPKYNVRLKDDKSFLVIKIEKKAEFPKVELVRFKNVDLNDKSAEYFGPYPSGELLKKSLRYLRKIFPYLDCTPNKFNTYKKKNRTCIYGDIHVCTGPCCGLVSEKDYKKNILYFKHFLQGKKASIIKSLEKEMKRLSKAQDFEAAAVVRNKIFALNHIKDVAIGLRDDVFNSSSILFKRIECYDISDIPVGKEGSGAQFAVGSMVVFTNGKADKDEYRRFKIKSQKSKVKNYKEELSTELPTSDLSRLQQVLERRFKNDWPMPDLLVIDGGPLQLKVAKEVLTDFNLDIPLISISKGPKRDKNDFHYSDRRIAQYFAGNLDLQNICISARDEAHRFAISYYRKLHQKSILK